MTDQALLLQGWEAIRHQKHTDAITAFEKALAQDASDVDALYGKGLAQRKLSQNEAAVTTFQQAYQIVTQSLEVNKGDDRFEMLKRMLSQRLGELNVIVNPI
jgi:Flp pilus assembly protein TadD